MGEPNTESPTIPVTPSALTEGCDSPSQFYEQALGRLNRLPTNYEAKKQASELEDRGLLLEQMKNWHTEIGYQPSDLDALNAIHITGSKGKGSTSVFVFSILAEYLVGNNGSVGDSRRPGPRKIGLYTSPHLRTVRERIRVQDSQTGSFEDTTIDKARFSRYVSELSDRLGVDSRSPYDTPSFAKFLTLTGFHAFIQEGVDAAVIEAVLGGRYDSTNILCRPSVCAITSLGLEHTEILGSTIEEIAWNKAGIMKPGVPVFTVPQEPSAMIVLQELAAKESVELRVVEPHPDIEHIDLGLAGNFQRMNASLAVAVAAEHLSRMGYEVLPDMETLMRSALPEKFRQGLERAQWPGRCETREHLGSRWLLDGAHTIESIEVLGAWASRKISEDRRARRVLIFNQQTKDSISLLRHLREVISSAMSPWLNPEETVFHQVIFCTNLPWEGDDAPDLERVSMTYSGESWGDMKVQNALAAYWAQISGDSAVTVVRTVEEAIRHAAGGVSLCRDREHTHSTVLITGSLHLVGSALEVLDTIE